MSRWMPPQIPCLDCGGSGTGPDMFVNGNEVDQGPCSTCEGLGLEPESNRRTLVESLISTEREECARDIRARGTK